MFLLPWHSARKGLFQQNEALPKRLRVRRKSCFWDAPTIFGVVVFLVSVLLALSLVLAQLEPSSGEWWKRIEERVDVVGKAIWLQLWLQRCAQQFISFHGDLQFGSDRCYAHKISAQSVSNEYGNDCLRSAVEEHAAALHIPAWDGMLGFSSYLFRSKIPIPS